MGHSPYPTAAAFLCTQDKTRLALLIVPVITSLLTEGRARGATRGPALRATDPTESCLLSDWAAAPADRAQTQEQPETGRRNHSILSKFRSTVLFFLRHNSKVSSMDVVCRTKAHCCQLCHQEQVILFLSKIVVTRMVGMTSRMKSLPHPVHRAVYDWDGRAPVALSGDKPVA